MILMAVEEVPVEGKSLAEVKESLFPVSCLSVPSLSWQSIVSFIAHAV